MAPESQPKPAPGSRPGSPPGPSPEPELHAETHKVGGEIVKQIVFGCNDGLISTFALLAGLAGAALDPSIILLTLLAEMFSGAISMGLGEFISSRSENEFYTNEIRKERAEIRLMPEIERREIREIYRERGLSGALLDQVVARLTANENVWLQTMLRDEIGIADMELANPLKTAVIMFGAFIAGALVPISPYFSAFPGAFPLATMLSFSALFVIGALRSLVTGKKWWLSGVEMLGIGLIAYVSTFGIGLLIGGVH